MKNSLITGTQYSFDLEGLANVGKTDTCCLRMSYKKGLVVDISLSTFEELDKEYRAVIAEWKRFKENENES